MELNLIKIVLRFELLILSFNFMLNNIKAYNPQMMCYALLWNHAKQNDIKAIKYGKI